MIKEKKPNPVLGSAAGTFKIPADFDAPLSEDELQLWEQGHSDDPLREMARPGKQR